MMENQTKDSQLFDLFDKLENGELISQDKLDSIKFENQELFEILHKSNLLRTAKKVEPDPFYAQTSQIRVYYRLVKDRGAKIRPLEQIRYFLSNLAYISPPKLSLRPVMTVLLALILTFSVFVGGAQAADNARPGQFLYPVDLALEQVQLRLTSDEQARLMLYLSFSEERLAEAQAEFTEGHTANAEIALAGYEKVQKSIYTQLANNQISITQELQTSAIQAHQKNVQVLTSLLETAPKTSQTIVLHAIEVSQVFTKLPTTAQEPATTPSETVDGETSTGEGGVAEGILPDEETAPTQTLVPTPSVIEGNLMDTTVWVFSVNVHEGPGLDYPVIGWLFQDQTVQSYTCENGFVFIPEFSGWARGTCFAPNPCGPPGSCLQILN
ncbi:MAG: DUF5667 domain-containing protein [Anaerolineales bacterium]|jgi:hypothetical protein